MKRRLFLFVLLFVSVLASAQSQKVTFDSKGTFTLSEVFRQVERQTNMTIAYNESSISVERMVSLESGSYTVQEVMNHALAGTGMEITVQGNIIAIVQAEKEQVYSGVVRDELAPIIGAVVMVDGDNSTAVITGMDGEFSVRAKEGSVLNVTILGYNDADVVLGSKVSCLPLFI